MKRPLLVAAALLAASPPPPALAQNQVQFVPGALVGSVGPGTEASASANDPSFDLDFRGGSPAALVREIGKASGHPVNVIIPSELAEVPLPPMNLRNVTVPALFSALQAAGPYGFVTQGPPSHDAVWVFYQRNPPPRISPPVMPAPVVPPQPVEPPRPREEVRVLNLRPYLSAGLSVEDITTAVRVACEMLPDAGQPRLTFHKETSLLITRGRPDQLELVERVLSQLDTFTGPPAVAAPFKMDPALARRYGLMPEARPPVVPPEPPVEKPPVETPRR